jgi:hypothetical protein
MKRVILLLLTVFSVTSCCPVKTLFLNKESRTGEEENLTQDEMLAKLGGEWINEEFHDVLVETRSPLLASQSCPQSDLRIYRNGNGYKVLEGHNFHDAGVYNIAKIEKNNEESDTYILYRGDPPLKDKIEIKFYPGNGEADKIYYHYLESTYRSTYSGYFIKLQKDLAEYVNENSIAGEYYDADGIEYVFNVDGTFKMAEREGEYKVNVDSVFRKTDLFWIVGKKERRPSPSSYGFKIAGNKLYLFNLTYHEADVIKREEKPIMILTKKEGK